jgi:hypothetical protein
MFGVVVRVELQIIEILFFLVEEELICKAETIPSTLAFVA